MLTFFGGEKWSEVTKQMACGYWWLAAVSTISLAPHRPCISTLDVPEKIAGIFFAQDYRPPDARHCVDQEQGPSLPGAPGAGAWQHVLWNTMVSPQEADRNLQITRMSNPRMVQVGSKLVVQLLPRDLVEWFRI